MKTDDDTKRIIAVMDEYKPTCQVCGCKAWLVSPVPNYPGGLMGLSIGIVTIVVVCVRCGHAISFARDFDPEKGAADFAEAMKAKETEVK
jgi:hypothetical protein